MTEKGAFFFGTGGFPFKIFKEKIIARFFAGEKKPRFGAFLGLPKKAGSC